MMYERWIWTDKTKPQRHVLLQIKIQFGRFFDESWHIRGCSTPPGYPGTILCHLDDHDRRDKVSSSTRGHQDHSHANAYWAQHCVCVGGGDLTKTRRSMVERHESRVIDPKPAEGTCNTPLAASASEFHARRFGLSPRTLRVVAPYQDAITQRGSRRCARGDACLHSC